MASTQSDLNSSLTATDTTMTLAEGPRRPFEVYFEPISSTTMTDFRTLLTSILPIRYPDKFYNALLSEQDNDFLCQVAICKRESVRSVVGGICCRVEAIGPQPPRGIDSLTIPEESKVYIQALAVKPAYRRLGIGAALLNVTLEASICGRWGRVVSVYGHVWEANEEGVDFYRRRGFSIGEVEPGYYRKLNPSGARTVQTGMVEWTIKLKEDRKESRRIRRKQGRKQGYVSSDTDSE